MEFCKRHKWRRHSCFDVEGPSVTHESRDEREVCHETKEVGTRFKSYDPEAGMTSEMQVRKALPISAAIQMKGSGLFAIVQVDASSSKNGRADAVVISGSFPTEKEAWEDAASRLPQVLQ